MRYFLFILVASFAFAPIVSADDQSSDGPFAVIELFSSEGCSSCPAADLTISKLTVWARENHQPVYPLVFHVDYWNGYGWRDVFSSQEFTQRQSNYAQIFRDQGMATPQIIVNGSDAFSGNDHEQLQKDLNNELSIPASVILRIGITKHNGKITVKYSSEGQSKGDVVNIALVERGLSTEVTAGENTGRTLHHDNVVREFRTMPLRQAPGEVTIPLTKLLDISQASVIVFVQNPQTMLIEAAKQLDLGND